MYIKKRKALILIGMLVLIVCVGFINNKLNEDQNLSASAGYTEYENEQMSLHDGDVLVDSLSLSAVPGTSSGPAATHSGTSSGSAATLPENSSGSAAGMGHDASESSTGSGMDIGQIVTSDSLEDLSNVDTYFQEVRATIDMDRNQVISMLTDVISEAEDGPEKNNATQQKLKIIDYMNKEKVIENLIRNKGFSDALVLMTDSSVNVTVNKQEITQSDVAKICDIVIRETGRNANQIVIQSKF